MNDWDRQVRGRLLGLSKLLKGSPGDDKLAWSAYLKSISQWSAEALVHAIDRAAQECEWFPPPAKLIGFCQDHKGKLIAQRQRAETEALMASHHHGDAEDMARHQAAQADLADAISAIAAQYRVAPSPQHAVRRLVASARRRQLPTGSNAAPREARKWMEGLTEPELADAKRLHSAIDNGRKPTSVQEWARRRLRQSESAQEREPGLSEAEAEDVLAEATEAAKKG